MAKRKTNGKAAKAVKKERGGIFRGDVATYEKTKSAVGNVTYDCGDKVAKELRGKPLDEIIVLASKARGMTQKELRDKYAHLNPGGQRMALGNLIRAASRR